MKSKTSFFNLTAFKKNLLRFSPIWALYTIFLLVVFFGTTGQDSVYVARDVVYMIREMAPVNLIYGGICAMFLFGDLFNSRLCNALHAFPVRREGWLLTGIAAGILFSVVPNLLMCLVASTVLQQYTYLAFVWLAVSTLQFLFYFGTAVLSAMCAGNRLGMLAVYGIIQFITVLVLGLAEMIYVPMLYGVKFDFSGATKAFPLGYMMSLDYLRVEYMHARLELAFEGFCGADWRYLALCAVAGVASMAGGWLIYRRRHLESAGDFIALRALAPVCLVIFSVGAGALLYAFAELMDTPSYIFLTVGLVVGYFAGRMLLGRTLRVFHKKSLIGLAVLAVIFAGSLGLTWWDPLGISGNVPNVDEVQWAAVFDNGYIYEGSNSRAHFEITDSREIAKLQSFHKELLNRKGQSNSGHTNTIQIYYKLKNGKTVQRYYEIPHEGVLAEQAKMYFSDVRYLFKTNDPETLYKTLGEVTIGYYTETTYEAENTSDRQILTGLLDAIKADCELGVMAQNWLHHDGKGEYHLSFTIKSQDDSYFHKWADMYITDDCKNTVAYLETILPLKIAE